MLSLFFLLIANASANIEVVSITGASNYIIDENTIKVFGGTSGDECDGAGNTCNSCTGINNSNGPSACNENRINDLGGILTINFNRTGTGTPIITNSNKTMNLLPALNEDEENSRANYVSIRWDIICSYIVETSNCDLNEGREVVHVGIDQNDDNILDSNEASVAINIIVTSMEDVVNMQTRADGIASFQVYPGDEKIYLLDSETDVYDDFEEGFEVLGSFPAYKGVTNFNEIRLYYEETSAGCSSISEVQNNSNYVYTNITNLDEAGSFDTDRVFFTGFENETQYVFRLGLVDEAGNVGLFTPNSSCDNRYHSATPDDVYGIFGDTDKCFIMETASASSLSPSIGILRKFRDRKLLESSMGKQIIDRYYEYSPHMAMLARENKTFKLISRVILIPITIFAFTSTYIDFVWTICLYALLFILFKNSVNLSADKVAQGQARKCVRS